MKQRDILNKTKRDYIHLKTQYRIDKQLFDMI